MFTDKLLQAFLEQFPDHEIEVKGKVEDGKVRWHGRITGPAGKETVLIAETDKLNLADVPSSLWDDLRNKLGAAQQVKDRKKLPASQRTALADGISGIVRKRDIVKEIVPLPTHGARTG